MKKQFLLLALAPMCVAAMTSCSNEKTQVMVFAAASLEDSLKALKASYESEHKDVEIVLNLASSGDLQTQIQNGAEFDMFFSASTAQTKTLTEGGFLTADSRVDLLKNELCLITPKGNAKGVTSFDYLCEHINDEGFIFCCGAIEGQKTVPAGKYTKAAMQKKGVDLAAAAEAGHVNYSDSVRKVLNAVKNSAGACGTVYYTDYYSAKDDVEFVEKISDSLTGEIIYPLSMGTASKDKEAAKGFYDYLKTDSAKTAFEDCKFVWNLA